MNTARLAHFVESAGHKRRSWIVHDKIQKLAIVGVSQMGGGGSGR